jgi:Cys-tRNA(Pro)/Cys-tRNA(Cys) deacylase
LTAIVRFLAASGLPYRVHAHQDLSSVAALAGANLPFPRDRWVKTLVFDTPRGPLLTALPAFDDVAYGLLAAADGTRRADLVRAGAATLAALDMAPGGAGPFPLAVGSRLIVDENVPDLGAIYVGGGRPDLTVEIDAATIILRFSPHIAAIARRRSG